MFQIGGQRHAAQCDGWSRRDFLSVGALGSLTLPQLLAAEQASGVGGNHKAVIMIYMAGARRIRISLILSPMRPRNIGAS